MKKNIAVLLVLAFVLVLSSAVCAQDDSKTLRLLWWQAPTILNIHLASGDKDVDAARMVLEPLAGFGPEGELIPYLAEEIPTHENGGFAEDLMSITWKLKQGLSWSDGTPFTAEDVVFTYEYITDEDVAASVMDLYANIAEIKAVDDYTVEIKYDAPCSNPYQAFIGSNNPIVQKAQFQDYMDENAMDAPGNMTPNGTGPFRVVEFRPGDMVTLEKNPYYRDADNVYFETVIMKCGGDSVSAARAVLQTGEYDYAGRLQIEQDILANISENSQYGEVVVIPGATVERMLVNHANPDSALGEDAAEPQYPHPFFSDLRVRQAFSKLVDRKLIQERFFGSAGVATCNLLGSIDSDVDTECPYDPEGAVALLEEAGWTDHDGDGIRDKDGVKMHVLLQTTVNALRQKMQEVIKASLESVGIEVELKMVDSGVFFSSDAGNPDTANKFLADLEIYANGLNNPDATRYLQLWLCSEINQKSNGWNLRNSERYCNADYEALYEKLQAETEYDVRQQIFKEMNDFVTADVAAIPIVSRATVGAKGTDIQGFVPNRWDVETWNVAEWSRE